MPKTKAPAVTTESPDAKLKEIICDQLGVDEGEVVLTAKFVDDLGTDSLDHAELVMTFEEAYDINIPDDAADKFITVRDVQNYIRQHTGKR